MARETNRPDTLRALPEALGQRADAAPTRAEWVDRVSDGERAAPLAPDVTLALNSAAKRPSAARKAAAAAAPEINPDDPSAASLLVKGSAKSAKAAAAAKTTAAAVVADDLPNPTANTGTDSSLEEGLRVERIAEEALNGAGERSFAATAREATVGVTAAEAPLLSVTPVITQVTDDQGSITGNVGKGGVTDDRLPQIKGTAEPGAPVTVFDNGVLLGTTTAQADGSWALTPTTPLADGPHSFTAIAADANENPTAPSAPYLVTVDTVAPVGTTLDAALDDVVAGLGNVPANGVTNDAKPTFSGKGEPGATITVLDNGVPIGTTTVAPNGSWSLTPAAPLADGPHSVTATATDAAGNTSAPTAPLPFTVDTAAPAGTTLDAAVDDVVPTVGNVPANGVTNDAKPTLTGKGEPGATITVYDANSPTPTTPIGTTTVAGDGTWSLTPATPLADGPHSITATATDAAGNTSVPTAALPFTVDTGAPQAPGNLIATDDFGPKTGTIPNNGVTDDNKPTISGGGATPGDTIKVYDANSPTPNVPIATTTVKPDGTWSVDTPVLADGPHVITATATDPAGNTSPSTPPLPFTVDTAAPPAPGGLTATDDVGPKTGTIPNNGVTDDNKPTISGGGATPGDTIKVYDANSPTPNVPIATTTVRPDGTWSVDTPVLADGPHVITATATDPAGNTSPPTAPLPFTVDTAAPDIGITLDANVAGDGIVNAAEAAAASVPVKGTVSGTFNPGDIVTLTLNGVTYTGPVAADGSFSINVPGAGLNADVDRTIEASVTTQDAAGNAATAIDTVGYRLATDPPKATIKLDANFTGDGVVNLAESLLAKVAVTGTVGGDVKVGDVVTVTINGKDFTTTVKAGNVFSVDVPGADLAADADRTIDAKVITVDANGNSAGAATQLVYGVDTVPPAAPTITDVVDDVGALTGSVPKNGATDDTLPQIKGTAEPRATVTVYDGNQPIGTTTADAQGNWSLTPESPLLNGPRSLTAVATDAAENPSAPSAPYPIVVDANGPVAPAITRIDDNTGSVQGPIQKSGVTDDTTPTVVGTAGPNLKINLFDNGQPIGTTTSNAAGDWSFTPTTPLAAGPHNISATAVSAAGVESAPTGLFPFVIDTTAPALTLTSANDDVGAAQGVITPGGLTDDATPTLKGTGEPGARVTVFDNGQPIGTTTVQPDGSWALTPTTPLADGPHSISATSTDPAGNTSPQTAPIAFTVDTSAVLDPVITRALDDVAPQTGVVASGGATNDKTPTLEGTARANDKVEVFYKDAAGNTVSLGSTTADAAGQWTLTPTVALTERGYDFIARATSPTGNLSKDSNTYSLTIDTTAPAAPVITAVNDDVGAKQGTVASGTPTDDTTPTIVGTGAKPGDTIKVYDGATLLGTTTVQPNGSWSLTPTTTLADGVHAFTAKEIDAAGNESAASNTYSVEIDTLAPAKPVITGVEDDVGAVLGNVAIGATTDDTRPKITGTAEKGATVDVYDNGKLIGSTVADPITGVWSLTPSAPLLNGPANLTAIASDAAGNPSVPSDPYAFIVDANGPVAPAITRIDDDTGALQGPIQKGGATDDTLPTVVGTAGPNLKINVYDGSTLLGSTTSNAQGDWSFTPTTPLVQGNHTISATAVSAAGVESDPTGPFPFVIDTTAPALALVSANDDVGASQGVITRGGITDDSTPTLKGTGEPGATVTVFDNGQPIGTTTVKPDGSWALTPSTPLADGPHSVTATATDAAGNTTPQTAAIPFTVDTRAVLDPVITRALDDVNPQTGVVANGGATNDTRPTLEGTARANDTVVVSYKDANGATLVLGSAIADAAGKWTLTPTTPLAERAYEFTAVATGATGNPSNPSNTYGLVIDATAPNAPVITAVTDDVGAFKGTVPTGAKTDDTTPTIVGTGVAGDTIRVLDGTTVLGTTTVKPDGSWSFTPTTTLADGPHEFKAIAIDAAANESLASNAYPVIVDTVAPAQPTITNVTDDVGAVQGNVAIGGTTDDTLPAIKGKAEAGATVSVFDGALLIGTALADANGDWSLTPTAPLLNGPRSLTAVATDAAGNPSVPSAPYPFTVDSNGPVAPAITRVDDNVGSVQGPIQKSGSTDDTTPTVVGTAGPNLKINVYDGLTLLGSTTSNAQGDWSFTPTTPLTTGPHNITATAVSAAGVESAPTGIFPFSIDTTAPALTLDTANDDVGTSQGVITRGGITDDATPTLRGTGEPGATVKVFDNGQLIGTTTVTPAGTWALTPSTPLADGPHSITATATDPAGNTSPQTAAIPFTVDTSAVVEPVITRAIDDFAPQTGVVPSGGVTNDKNPTLEGTARAGDRVEIFYTVPNGANVSIGFTTANANGQWSLTPATALTERSYNFVAVATGATGNPSSPSNTYSLLIDATAPNAPAITTVTDDVGSKQGAVAGGSTTDDTTPTIVGTGTAGDTIRVLDGSTVLGTTVVKADGSWSLTPTTTLADGLHNFRAVELDAAGNESLPSNTYAVIIDTQAPARPTITGVTDDVGAVQGNVASGGTTDDVLPGIKGRAEAGATVNVFDGARLVGTTTADANGDWTLAVTVALASGAHNFTATATDAAGNPSGASDPYGITVDPSLVIVVNPGSATATSEEGLIGGVKDATGSPADTTDATSAAGTLSASGPGGAATTWTLTAPTTVITAGGVAVTWTGSGTQSLVGTAGGVQVATLSINNSGAYSFNLLAPIDHPVKNAEDVLTLNFGVNAGNGTSTGAGTLALTVEDDAPSAVVPQTRDAALLDTNLLITLDISGSMNTGDGINGQTRLQSAIQSINTLLDKYDGFGDVRVRLVTFSTNANAVGTVWTDVATAKAQLAALAAGGGTNYDEGLGDAITAFGSAGKLAGGQNVSYFFSDGAPTFGSGSTSELTPAGQSPGTPPTNGTGFDQSGADVGIQSAEETAWINFLNANQVKSFAIGFGAGAPTTTYLNPIAYDGQQSTNTNGLVVTNFAQLDSALATTVTNNITGNLLGGDLISATGGLGGDAPGFVLSLTVEGTTYTYSPLAGGSVTATGGANRGVFDTTTDSITITTAAGGRFIVDMDGGEYRYESPTTVPTAIAETFNYVLTDRDGDTVGSSVTVNVSRVTATVGTAGADTLAGTAAPDFIMGLAGDDNIGGNAGDDKLFGGNGNDSLAGGAGNDSLSGGADNDVLGGGDGADRLTGGTGSDALSGGAGVDVFAWSFGDNGTAAARPVDTIADFNVAAVSASGDVLDLRDLLIGELKGAVDATHPNGTVGNLQNFLDFNVTGGNTEIRVSSGGQFAGGTYAAGSEDQRIVLQGVDIRSSLSLAATATDAQIIQELLNRGKLIADGP